MSIPHTMKEWIIKQFIDLERKILSEEKSKLFFEFVSEYSEKGWKLELQECLIEAQERIKNPKKMKGYTHFCVQNRFLVKQENPNMSGVEITKKLESMWFDLDEADKQVWRENQPAILHF